MNKIDWNRMLRITALALLAVTLTTGCASTKSRRGEAKMSAKQSERLAREMIGTWVHVGRPGNIFDVPEKGGRYKYRTGTHWAVITADPESGIVREIFGGTYTMKGNEYIETQTFADYNWARDNGKSFAFTVKIEDDTMTQLGVGNPFTEVWKRVK